MSPWRPSRPLRPTIAGWVEELDSSQSTVRENATRRLIEARGAAIGPVAAAVPDATLEATCRAIRILEELSRTGELGTEKAAVAALEKLVQQATQSAARRARAALEGQQPSERRL